MSFHKIAPVKNNRKPAPLPKKAAPKKPAPAAKHTNRRPVGGKGGGKGC
jgi:hypothetical protein